MPVDDGQASLLNDDLNKGKLLGDDKTKNSDNNPGSGKNPDNNDKMSLWKKFIIVVCLIGIGVGIGVGIGWFVFGDKSSKPTDDVVSNSKNIMNDILIVDDAEFE